MKKLNFILNIIMGTFVGVFIGHCIHVVLDFKKHPELYAMQSAPWYTSILVYGAFTLVVLVICIGLKYSLQGTTQGRYLTGGVPPVRFSM